MPSGRTFFAIPSEEEGFGIVYREMLACGKTVLGGDRDGAVEALRQGTLGALVDPDNLEQFERQTHVELFSVRKSN
ncbi:MAG: glycosyltransferase [Cyanobacteriota bacterium]|nr:glycosyltransferase [Cyanobacteriota bacterium]